MTRLLSGLAAAFSLAAQTAEMTAQLERTLLYQDVALSPDGKRVAWAQTLASLSAPEAFITTTEGASKPVAVRLRVAGLHKDSDPAWSPDSGTLALFSTAGEKEKDQLQLWTVAADGGSSKKRTKLNGYASQPRCAHECKHIAF